jgi:hypothetical protein
MSPSVVADLIGVHVAARGCFDKTLVFCLTNVGGFYHRAHARCIQSNLCKEIGFASL